MDVSIAKAESFFKPAYKKKLTCVFSKGEKYVRINHVKVNRYELIKIQLPNPINFQFFSK